MLTLYLCAFLCACVFIAMRVRSRSNAYELPPKYPGAIPLIGHTHLLLSDIEQLWLIVQDTARHAVRCGGVSHVILGRQIYYMIADPEDALTASNACLQKHFAFAFGKAWLGDGLVTGSGEIWKRHRKLLYPAFGLPIIHGFLGVFNDQAKKLCKNLEHFAGKGPFDHNDPLRTVALETFCLGTFGVNAVEDENFTKTYMDSVDTAMDMATNRFLKFYLHTDFMYRLSGIQKKEETVVNAMNSMSTELMQRKKVILQNNALNKHNNHVKSNDLKYKPVMDLLLELSMDGTLSDKEIREEMDTMIAAGFETTSNTLLFILMLLGAHPNTQHKMLQELLEVLGPDRDVEKDDINKLVYTNAVIMESLRLFPAVPVLPRYVDKDVKLKNYTMRAGSQCVLYPLVSRCDPFYGEDGEKFRPERWLDTDLSGSKEYAAFGLGKRSCIGRQYAVISMKVFLSHLIRQYKIEADMSKLKTKCVFVLKATSGHEISIEKRNTSSSI